jgi:hypothetical protein
MGLSAAAPFGFNVGLTPTVTFRRFDEAMAIYAVRREDETLGVRAHLSHRNARVRGFTPTLEYSFTDNRSTVDLFDYTRHTVDFGLARQF